MGTFQAISYVAKPIYPGEASRLMEWLGRQVTAWMFYNCRLRASVYRVYMPFDPRSCAQISTAMLKSGTGCWTDTRFVHASDLDKCRILLLQTACHTAREA